MYKRGMFLALLALLSVVPAVGTDDRGGSGLSRLSGPWLVRPAASTACPFRRFPWLCQRPHPRRPR